MVLKLWSLLFSFISIYVSVVYAEYNDAKLKVPDIIRKYGYPCQVHQVTTEDGYILTLHRIPHGRQRTSEVLGPPVILQHGIMGSSADWIVLGVGNALAYLLADLGYDVWLPNSRGNTYSRKHRRLDPDTNSQFWRFSWHQMGVYDLPASIDHILSKSQQTQLFFIGHSQGTTVFYVMASEKPEYLRRIRAQFSLAPVSFMSHMFNPLLRLLSRFDVLFHIGAEFIGVNEFIPSTSLLNKVAPAFCKDGGLGASLCGNIVFMWYGFNRQEFNETLLPIIYGHLPAGCSVDQLFHYGQLINTGRFCKYDYGIARNILEYHSTIPPDYKLENVVVPSYLFYAANDWLSSTMDVEKLTEKLPNVVGKFLSDDFKWSHGDYIFGKNVKTKVYDIIINQMAKH